MERSASNQTTPDPPVVDGEGAETVGERIEQMRAQVARLRRDLEGVTGLCDDYFDRFDWPEADLTLHGPYHDGHVSQGSASAPTSLFR